MLKAIKILAILVGTALVLASCSNKNTTLMTAKPEKTANPAKSEGYVIKGLFTKQDKACLIVGQNFDVKSKTFENIGSVYANITDKGKLDFVEDLPPSDYYDVTCKGHYLDETTGAKAKAITLRGFFSVAGGIHNITVFTDILADSNKQELQEELSKPSPTRTFEDIDKSNSKALAEFFHVDTSKEEVTDVSLLNSANPKTAGDIALLVVNLNVLQNHLIGNDPDDPTANVLNAKPVIQNGVVVKGTGASYTTALSGVNLARVAEVMKDKDITIDDLKTGTDGIGVIAKPVYNDISGTVGLENQAKDLLTVKVNNGMLVLPNGTQSVFLPTMASNAGNAVYYTLDDGASWIELATNEKRSIPIASLQTATTIIMVEGAQGKVAELQADKANVLTNPLPTTDAKFIPVGYFSVVIAGKDNVSPVKTLEKPVIGDTNTGKDNPNVGGGKDNPNAGAGTDKQNAGAGKDNPNAGAGTDKQNAGAGTNPVIQAGKETPAKIPIVTPTLDLTAITFNVGGNDVSTKIANGEVALEAGMPMTAGKEIVTKIPYSAIKNADPKKYYYLAYGLADHTTPNPFHKADVTDYVTPKYVHSSGVLAGVCETENPTAPTSVAGKPCGTAGTMIGSYTLKTFALVDNPYRGVDKIGHCLDKPLVPATGMRELTLVHKPQAGVQDVTVRILLMYTKGAAKEPYIKEKLCKTSQLMQTAMDNTQAGVKFDVVIYPLTQAEDDSILLLDLGADHKPIDNGDGSLRGSAFDEEHMDVSHSTTYDKLDFSLPFTKVVQDKKKLANADLVSFIIGVDPTTMGYIEGEAGMGAEYSVVNSSRMAQKYNTKDEYVSATLAHEVGHNFGLDHDDENASSAKLYGGIGHAYVNQAAPSVHVESDGSTRYDREVMESQGIFRTIMSYSRNMTCGSVGASGNRSCPIVPYYSINSAKSGIYYYDPINHKQFPLGDAMHDARSIIRTSKTCISKIAETGYHINGYRGGTNLNCGSMRIFFYTTYLNLNQ